MRRVLIFSALIAITASPALAAQDRYGPPRPAGADRVEMAPLPQGALLNWKGKSAPVEPVAEPAPQRFAPEPFSAPAPRDAQATPAAPYAPVAMTRPSPVQPAPAAPPPQRAPVAATPTPAPAKVAASAPAPSTGGGYDARPRFYSVSRQFGAEPDPITVGQPRRGEALTLAEPPVTPGLGRTFAPLDDGRPAQAVAIPDTKQNAAANRVSRLGF